MTIVADILDFLFVFLPLALLSHLAFRIGLAQGRGRGGTPLFVGSCVVAFAFLFKIYFDFVFGSTDSFWLFILTFVTSIGLAFAFVGTSRTYSFLLVTRLKENRYPTRGMKIGGIAALIYAAVFLLYLVLVKHPAYLSFSEVCYLLNQVLLFGIGFLVAEFFDIVERPSPSAQARLTRILSIYYLIGPLIWLAVISSTKSLYVPPVLRVSINFVGTIVSSVVALVILRFIRLHLPIVLRQVRSNYLDTLRVNVLRDLYLVGSGITVFIFVILLLAESFYENLRISTLRGYAESRLSTTKLAAARMRSTLQDVTSKLQGALESSDRKLFLSNLHYHNDYIDVVGGANEKGQITFLRKSRLVVSDSMITSLLKENQFQDRDVSIAVVKDNKPGLEFFALVKGKSSSDSIKSDFALISIQKTTLGNALSIDSIDSYSALVSLGYAAVYSPTDKDISENFRRIILSKNNLDMNELSSNLGALSKSNFEGYEILRGENPAGVGEYYLLVTSPLEFENYEWILTSLEREDRVSQLFQPTNSLLILAGLLILGLFGGGALLIYVSFRWSMKLEKEVQRKVLELRSSEDKYRRIVENPYIGSFIMVDGRIIFSNTRLAGILEVGVEQLSGSDFFSFIDEKDVESLKNIFEAIVAGEKSGDKWQVEAKIGPSRSVSLSGYSSIINIGNKMGVQSLIIDSTNELREKEKMEQFEKLESMATLAAGIAHDFNNILQVVLGSSQLLQRKLNDPELIKHAENITNVAIRGSDLSKRLLTFGRQKGLEERKVFDINSIIIESLKVFEETFPRTIRIETQLNPDSVNVEGDQSQIQQVIFNLAVNARDAMAHGGTLTLKTEIRETSLTEAEIYQVAQGKYAFIMVKDNGEGIPPELMTKVFEPFFTTKEPGKGTGLGLSVVYGIVRSHKGFLKVYSELKRGTVFNIYLPLTSQIEKEVSLPQRVKEPALPYGKRILFVDDEEGIREAAQFLLEQAGLSVVTAKDGMKAIEIYKREWEKTDLVVLDLNMPELSGREVLENLFIINPEVRVLISTGYITSEERAGLKGVVEVIEKPFDFDQLIEKVRIALERPDFSKL